MLSPFILNTSSILFFYSCSKIQNLNKEKTTFEYIETDIIEDTDHIRDDIFVSRTEISDFYKDQNFLAIGILKGSLFFLSDLTREINNEITKDNLM